MKITNCKLIKRSQKKLLEFFALQVTARSAADILSIQPNSAILFYRKICMVISHHLALAADEVFDGSVELDESYFGGRRGDNVSLICDCTDQLDATQGKFGSQEQIYQQLWCLPKIEDQYVQVCTFTVGGHYGGACLRSDPSRIIVGNSDMQPLRVLKDEAFLGQFGQE